MPVFMVDADKCRRDGICSKVCPAQIIVNNDDGLPFLMGGGAERCIGCGQCVAFCPHGAASLDGLPMEKARKIDRKLLPSPEAVAELMKTRRSVRIFSSKKVPDDVIMNIVEMSSNAPTAKNVRGVRWVVVNDENKIQEIVNAVGDWMAELAGPNPESAEERAYKMLANLVHKGKDPILRGAKQLAVAVIRDGHYSVTDSAIALSYFELAAHSLGVGCCWAGYFTSAAKYSPVIRQILGLSTEEMVGGAQMLGYPGIRATYTPPRTSLPISWI